MKHKTREQWLTAATKLLTKRFKEADAELPDKIRFSCSFPFGSRKFVGQCWSTKCSKDGTTEVLVSPVMDDAVEVLSTLMHELVHASLGTKVGHRAPFKRLGEKIGLTGKPTHMGADAATQKWLKTEIVPKLGEYPHAALIPSKDRKKQGTRLLKVECEETGYVVRITRKWLTEYGAPNCACCDNLMVVS